MMIWKLFVVIMMIESGGSVVIVIMSMLLMMIMIEIEGGIIGYCFWRMNVIVMVERLRLIYLLLVLVLLLCFLVLGLFCRVEKMKRMICYLGDIEMKRMIVGDMVILSLFILGFFVRSYFLVMRILRL